MPEDAPQLMAERGSRLQVSGEVVPKGRGYGLLALLTGWILLRDAWYLVARYLLGARHEISLGVDGQWLEVEQRRRLLGRELSTRTSTVALGSLRGWGLERRKSATLLLIGVAAFSLGGILGLTVAYDSLSAGFPLFGLVGLSIWGLGALMDLGLTMLWDRRIAGSRLWLVLPGGVAIEVSGVDPRASNRLLAAVEQRIGR